MRVWKEEGATFTPHYTLMGFNYPYTTFTNNKKQKHYESNKHFSN